ncbi:MFS transporter [Micromonospora sp. NPDC050397]|uniref:MFS transporter n=1 Tax=Micromonospora sp. NPDC050397 TaxID=3364279 RepID=UPI00384B838E
MSRFVEILVPARFGRGFRWLLASSWTTNLGDGIAMAAGPLLVASITTDAFLVSLAALLRWAPPLLFGLYAGALSDRFDRRRIIIVANLVRIVALAALVTMLVTGGESVTAVLVALGLLATAEVFADNTTGTLLPMMVHRDDLAVANARLQTGFITLNQLVGPAVGAALFAAGSAWPFVTEAVLLCAGVGLVSRLALPAHGRDREQRSSLRREVAQGLRWTLAHPAVRTLALTILIFNVTYGAAWSILVLYATERLDLGATGYGLLSTVTAIGGLAGTALYGWITRRVSLGNVMRVGLVIETLTHLALALTSSPWLAAAILFVFGAHAFVWGTTSTTIRQRAVPTEFQGRVGSVYMSCLFGGLVIGSVIGGLLASRVGVTAPFWFAFAGSAVFVVALWRNLTLIAHEDERPLVLQPIA